MNRSDAALNYLKQGFSVIPVLPGEKRPATEWKEYQERYAADEEVVAWWERWPDANLGLITGVISNLSVIDVDGQVGLTSINGQPIKPPTTRVIKTPHGWHLYYKYREDWHTGAGFLPGIDVRSDGGYVVAPPSRVDNIEYTVLRDNPIAEITLPLAAFQPHTRQGAVPSVTLPESHRPTWVRDSLANGAPEHKRNDTATRLVGYFHSLGTPKDVIEVLLTDFAARCQPPISLRELQSTIDSVTRYQSKVVAARIAEPPQFQDEGDTLLYTWPQHAVSIRLSNLDTGKDGIHSQIEIEAGPPGIPPIIYGPANFNLVSTPAKASLVKYMSDRYALDWAGILETASRLAVMEVREGEPLVDLRDYVSASNKWLLYPFILEDQATFLFADGGSGKSLLALAILLTIQEDTPGLLGKAPTSPVRGLYLDWESTAQEHSERYRLLLAGAGVDPSTVSVLYRRCASPLEEQVSQLQRFIVGENIGFAVVDSVVAACGAEAEHSDTARRFFGALRRLRVPTLCVTHTTKDNDRSHKPFGSTFWNNLARNTWELQRQQEEGEDRMSIALYNRKINPGKRHKPIGYTITFAADTISFRSQDVMDVPEFASVAPLHTRIADLLTRGCLNQDEIARLLTEEGSKPVDATTVKTVCNRHKQMFRRLEDGRWALSDYSGEP